VADLICRAAEKLRSAEDLLSRLFVHRTQQESPESVLRERPGSGRSFNLERRHFRRIGAVRMPEADRSSAV
jgi:hypothetical protein